VVPWSIPMLLPDEAGLGLAWHVTPQTLLCAELHYTAWQRFVVVEGPLPALDLATLTSPRWHSTFAGRLGVEWHGQRFSLRGGLAFEPSPSALFAPLTAWIAFPRVAVALGAGYTVSWPTGHVAFDLGYRADFYVNGDVQVSPSSFVQLGGLRHVL